MKNVQLVPLEDADVEQFVLDNQEAFKFGALEEFGERDNHFEEDGEIISRETILHAIESGEAYRIWLGDREVGGAVVSVDGDKGDLQLLFVVPSEHSKGIGYAAWCEIEKTYPDVKVWETVTPYFEKRNVHFYVNRCGFKIVEFFNEHHADPNDKDGEMFDMFRFEKIMKH